MNKKELQEGIRIIKRVICAIIVWVFTSSLIDSNLYAEFLGISNTLLVGAVNFIVYFVFASCSTYILLFLLVTSLDSVIYRLEKRGSK